MSDSPTVASRKQIARTVNAFGFAFIPKYTPSAKTLSVGESIGTVLELGSDSPVHQIRPKAANEAPKNTYSGIFGLGQFPMHTDMAHWRLPPRYMVLRCVLGDPEVSTLLFDSTKIISEIGTEALRRTFVRPRRSLAGHMQILRLLDHGDDGIRAFRWDQTFLQPASAVSKDVFDAVQGALQKISEVSVTLGRPGDTLVVDNWRMLHARSPVPQNSRRIIDRAYLGALH